MTVVTSPGCCTAIALIGQRFSDNGRALVGALVYDFDGELSGEHFNLRKPGLNPQRSRATPFLEKMIYWCGGISVWRDQMPQRMAMSTSTTR